MKRKCYAISQERICLVELNDLAIEFFFSQFNRRKIVHFHFDIKMKSIQAISESIVVPIEMYLTVKEKYEKK